VGSEQARRRTVYGGRDAAVNDRIGRILLDVLPAGAERITARAIVGADWAEVAFEYADEAGSVGSFDFDNTPSRAAGDISEALMDLRKLMAQPDAEPWNRGAFTAHGDGRFRVEFSYEELDDDEP